MKNLELINTNIIGFIQKIINYNENLCDTKKKIINVKLFDIKKSTINKR